MTTQNDRIEKKIRLRRAIEDTGRRFVEATERTREALEAFAQALRAKPQRFDR
jgi:hypothetical protein